MKTITFVEHSGARHDVPVTPGQTLAQAALDNAVPGLDGDCGGNCACATCHVFLPDDWLDRIAPQSDMERQMLEMTPELTGASRLACQITVTEAMDGLVVGLPEFQM